MEDEITSLNAIYGDGTLTRTSDRSETCILQLPSIPISLRVFFPQTYPEEPPSILGPESVGSEFRKGAAKDIVDNARRVIGESFQAGEPCLFELVEQLSLKLQELNLLSASATDENTVTEGAKALSQESHPEDQLEGVSPSWSLSDPVTEKKSTFLARAALVYHPNEAKLYLRHLLNTDKKAAKATHNITAWRIRGENDVTYQDCDDDGESAAGGRLLHLLQIMGVWDVMVVVTRWYGGVHLGADRFRIIGGVAREAVVRGGFERVKEG